MSQWEADAARETRKRKARDLTGVWAGPCDEAGLAELRAVGPTDQIAKIMGAVEALAQQWLRQPQHPDDHPADAAGESWRPVKPSPGQLRLKALHDLVCEGTDVSFQVTVQFPIVPDDDAGGAADRPPPRGAAFTAEADDGSPPSGCSPPAGCSSGCSSAPPPDPSRHPDDEDRRWPIGATEGGNLASLCKHHHDAKTARHWDYELSRDGVCTWTSPTGRTYVTHPDSAWDDQATG